MARLYIARPAVYVPLRARRNLHRYEALLRQDHAANPQPELVAHLHDLALGNRLIADYEAGDVVLHSPYMIHAATCNDDPSGRLRLSTDIRYQNVRDEIDARWANHWSLDDML